jgi:LacI family transcriptional regulator
MGDISNLRLSIWGKEIEQWADRFYYTTFILNTDENQSMEKKAINSALSKKVDGILLCPAQESTDNVRYLQRTRIPFVLIGRRFSDIACSYVVSDDLKGGYLAARHLIRNGHRRILMLNTDPAISSAVERKAGYMQALKEAAIPYDETLVHQVELTAGGCASELRKIIQSGLDFTGIFAFSDLIAFEAIYTLNELGIRVPEQKGIVGFDNIQEHALLSMPLDTITHVGETVPIRAVKMLMDMIESDSAIAAKQVVLDVALKERGSAGRF